MRTTFLAALLFFTFNALAVGGEDAKPATLRARPVQIISARPARTGGQRCRVMQHKAGFQNLSHRRRRLIGVKDKSLVIDSMTTPAGKDISKKRNGHPAYEQGSFPKTSEDGKFCIFSLEYPDSSQFGQVEKLVVKGSITALLASHREEKKIELDVGNKKSQKVGPFTLQCGKPSGGMFGGGFTLIPGVSTNSSPKHNVGVKFAGPMEAV